MFGSFYDFFFYFIIFFPLAASTANQRASERQIKTFLFIEFRTVHTDKEYISLFTARWTHCHLATFSPVDQLLVTQGLIWFSTAV